MPKLAFSIYPFSCRYKITTSELSPGKAIAAARSDVWQTVAFVGQAGK
jgi:hypothetical protein